MTIDNHDLGVITRAPTVALGPVGRKLPTDFPRSGA